MYIDKSLSLPEVFDRVAKRETVAEKVELVKAYESKHLRWFVDVMYNGDFTDIEVPDYKPSNAPAGIAYMNIKNAIPRLEAVMKNRHKPRIVERNLKVVLESVTQEEAQLIVKMIKGERKIDGVSKTVFKKAFPEFF